MPSECDDILRKQLLKQLFGELFDFVRDNINATHFIYCRNCSQFMGIVVGEVDHSDNYHWDKNEPMCLQCGDNSARLLDSSSLLKTYPGLAEGSEKK